MKKSDMKDSHRRTYDRARAKCGFDSKAGKAKGWSFPDHIEDECRQAFLDAKTHPAVDEARKARDDYERAVFILD